MKNNFLINSPQFDCKHIRIGSSLRIKCDNYDNPHKNGALKDVIVSKVGPLNLEVVGVDNEGDIQVIDIPITKILDGAFTILGELTLQEGSPHNEKNKSKKNNSEEEMFD